MVMLLLFGCGDAVVDTAADTASAPTFEPMTGEEWLIRLSMDLRYRMPAPEELEAVRADPSLADGYLDAWLQAPEYPEVVRTLFSEVYRTRTEDYIAAEAVGLTDEIDWQSAIGDEPLRILGRVADEDRPWTEIVTADWVMADDQLAGVFELEVDGGSVPEGEWVEARYTDGRPGVGVLSTTAFWWRYGSNLANKNRHRANAVTRVLLCDDFLARPVSFDVSEVLGDGDDVEEAILTDPSCLACHASLEPIASYLWGFFYYTTGSLTETRIYHPAREQLWREQSGVAPAWYGDPATGLADLGVQIAGDPRFPSCAVEQVASGFWRRPVGPSDQEELDALREVFLNEGLTMRPLMKAVMEGERYASTGDGGVVKMMGPPQLSGAIDAITGFRWTYQGNDMLTDTRLGFRVMAGGSNGLSVLTNTNVPTPTVPLVHERVAEAAAWTVVHDDAELLGELPPQEGARLFTVVTFRDVDDTEAVVREELVNLWWQVLGEQVAEDSAEIDRLYELYRDLFALIGDEREAWISVLSALLREPGMVFY